jgi:PAS domain S-box-containing protein
MPFMTQPVRSSLQESLSGLALAARGTVAPAALEGGDGGLALYRAIAEQLPRGAVFVVDQTLRYVLAAGSGLNISGFVPADFEGRSLREALPSDLLTQHTEDYRAILGGASIVREHQVGGHWYASHGVPLADEHGHVHAALVVSYDITDRKRAETRLYLLDRLAGNIRAAAGPDDIAAAACGLIAEVCGAVRCAFARIHGELGAAELGAGESHSIVLAEFGAGVLARLARGETVQTGAPPMTPAVAYVLVPHMAAGRPAGITAIVGRAGRTWRAEDLALAGEIADRAWVHMDRLWLMGALQEADRCKDQFLAALAQQLRSPLSVVRNSLALLGRPGSAVMPEAVVALMERQFGHMNRLIEDVLDTSYICYGQAQLKRHRLVLQDAVLAAVDAARALVSARTHQLSVAMPREPIMLSADPTRLAQAFNGVLANAIKYSRAPARILVEVELHGTQALVRVTDNGIGMSPRTLARLFELFTRVDDKGAPVPGGGLGVGLWIARQLVEAHGGRIAADSRGPDLGSTFTITLPVEAGARLNK